MPKSKTSIKGSGNDGEIKVTIKTLGPSQEQLAGVGRRVAASVAVQRLLQNTNHRLLHIEMIEEQGDTKSDHITFPDRFRAVFYDYTHNRVINAEGSLAQPDEVAVSESGHHPLPTSEEFEAAVAILRQDPQFEKIIGEAQTLVYPPMPPLILSEEADGRSPRVVAVGILPRNSAGQHEIVGVNLNTGQIHRYSGRAPATAMAGPQACGPPNASQATVPRHTPGTVAITITHGNTLLWKFNAVRPSASSGTNGAGVELQHVEYRGKSVLYRAHVPILNVKYDPTPQRLQGACGPYRDWQWMEGMIQAAGTSVAPGFLLCQTPAKTILDTGSDAGTVLGTAIYVQGREVVLVCEMEAGWYRYVSMWRFHVDGTLRPRFGFSAVTSSCVCNIHHHHCYWRLDFDIKTAGQNRIREYNNPPIIANTNWHTKKFEIRRARDPLHHRKWIVENTLTNEGYEIVPGQNDGVATASPDWPFGRGDLWFLRYHGNEIDDGTVAVGPPYEANIDPWVNGEPIDGQDVVVWYGAHFTHDVQHEKPGEHGHIVGPDLKPINW